MPAGAEFTLPLEVHVPASVLAGGSGGVLDILRQARSIHVRVKGTLGVQAAGFSFRVPIDHEKEHELRL
jgi:hypothetical protein